MYKIRIQQPGTPDMEGELPNGVYIAGSGADCQIRINHPDVSPRQLQIIVRDNDFIVADLGSAEGSEVNGIALFPHRPSAVAPGSVITCGRVRIVVGSCGERPQEVNAVVQNNAAPAAYSCCGNSTAEPDKRIPLLAVSGIAPEARAFVQEVKSKAHPELLKRLNLKKLIIAGSTTSEVNERAKSTIKEILSQLSVTLPQGVTLGQIERELVQEAIGLGPLEYLIEMDDISEIMVNGAEQIYVEKAGVIYRTDTAFADNNQVISAIERIVSPLGRRIDESSPMVDARLSDGSRVNAIIPPLALSGPSITIRKFSRRKLTMDDLIGYGSISPAMAEFLKVCVEIRKNILISGGTGSGKTTLLNVLSSYLPNRERIITIEDAAELQLDQEHLVRLEARPPNIEGRGEISIRDLVRNSLRMRPDRIVVGECRGGEALDMLQAMNTGHDGSLTTIHANSPRDALARLETLVLMAGFDLPLRAIREQIASAIDIVVQISRERDGSRKVVQISEITKMEGDIISMQELFAFKIDGWDENNMLKGSHEPTGTIPTFLEELERSHVNLDLRIFRKQNNGNGGIANG